MALRTTGRVVYVCNAIAKAKKLREYVPNNHTMTEEQCREELEKMVRKDHINMQFQDFTYKYLDYLK